MLGATLLLLVVVVAGEVVRVRSSSTGRIRKPGVAGGKRGGREELLAGQDKELPGEEEGAGLPEEEEGVGLPGEEGAGLPEEEGEGLPEGEEEPPEDHWTQQDKEERGDIETAAEVPGTREEGE